MRVSCELLVPDRFAATFRQRPDRVNACMVDAAAAMEEKAGERHRTLNEPPRLVKTRETGLGIVTLTFEAETRPL